MKELNIVSIGMFVIFTGIAIVIIGSILTSKSQKTESKIAIGGFIGPIPFGFGNDKTMVYVVIAISAIVAISFFVMNFINR